MQSSESFDCAILGAGVIGLSLALELAVHGQRVAIFGTKISSTTASWAAAGILPPADFQKAADPYGELQGLSHALYPDWVERIEDLSQMKVEFQRCGGWHLARGRADAAALHSAADNWREEGIEVEAVDPQSLAKREPALEEVANRGTIRAAMFLPQEGQVRPPRLLQALRSACARLGVWHHDAAGLAVPVASNGHWCLADGMVRVSADCLCICAGAWSAQVLSELNVPLHLEPRRGQMVLLAISPVRLHSVVNEGPRYLVPRSDGQILVGSTVEDVGFDVTTRDTDLDSLVEFAVGLVPRLSTAKREGAWAGLRPLAGDGLPYLGQVPGHDRAFLATGHFRGGIHLAPATARLMRERILRQPLSLDLGPFRVDR